MHPFKVAAIFLGAACTSFFFGVKIMQFGLIGFRDGTYPLTLKKNLEGNLARLAASIIILFGLIAYPCGIVTLVIGYFRMRIVRLKQYPESSVEQTLSRRRSIKDTSA